MTQLRSINNKNDDVPGHRSRLKLWVRRSAWALAVLALLVAGALWFLLATQPGARWLFAQAGTFIPGSLEVAEMTGPIRGPLTAEGLVWENEGLRVRIDRLELRWRLRALLARQLDIEELVADGVHVQMAGGDAKEEPTSLPDVHLPINIIVRQARVNDIQVAGSGDGSPFKIGDLNLVTNVREDIVEIETLTVASDDFNLDVSGNVEPVGAYAVDLEIEWSVRVATSTTEGATSDPNPDDSSRASPQVESGRLTWAGAGTLEGSLEQLQIVQKLAAPLNASLDVELTQPLRDLGFDGSIEIVPFELRLLDPGLPDMKMSGIVRGRGRIEDLAAEFDVAAESPDYGPLLLSGTVERRLADSSDGYRFRDLTVTSRSAPTRVALSADAELVAGEDPSFDVHASWTDLVWPLIGEPELRSSQGSVHVEGTTANYALEVAATLLSTGLPPIPVSLKARGDADGMTIEGSQAQLLDGVVTASGDIAWAPRVEWALELTGDGIDPQHLWQDGPGSLGMRASSSGYLGEAGPVGNALVRSWSGSFRGSPVEGGARLELAGDRITVSQFNLGLGSQGGAMTLRAEGQVAPALDFTFALDAENLGLVLHEGGGSLVAQGRLSGPSGSPRLELEASGRSLLLGDLSASEIEARADLDLASAGEWSLDAIATGVSSGEQRLEQADLKVTGTRARHQLVASARTADVQSAESGSETTALRAVLQGGLSEQAVWTGELTTLDLDFHDDQRWSLASAAALVVSAADARLERLCEVSGDSRLCLEGSWQQVGEAPGSAPAESLLAESSATSSRWTVNSELTGIPLSLASPFLPPELEIDGTVGGTINAQGSESGSILANADLLPGPGSVAYPMPDGSTEVLRFARGELTGAVTAEGLTANLRLPLPDLGFVEGSVDLAGYRIGAELTDEQPIAGRLYAEIQDLSFLQAFSDQIESTAGRLDADMTFDGSVGQPGFHGRAALTEGEAAIPELGITLRDMQFTALDDAGGGEVSSGALRLSGSLRSGEGTLMVTGSAPPIPTADSPVRLSVRGSRFAAMDTREVELYASPDLELIFDGSAVTVTGEVLIPEANVEIKKAPVGAIVASDDVVFVGSEVVEPKTEMPLTLRVRVVLGDAIEVAALGLRAEPTGSLLLVDEPGRPTYGTGEINVSGGTYQAYGQDLAIERGRLLFGGPVDMPRIDIRAFREARDGVIAGLEARGTLDSPEISLWSTPTLPQADQLSYILLGRPIDQTSESDGDLLAKAAVSLGVKGGNLLAERLAARFGMDEARIETDGGLAEASLVLGKFLTPRLYIAYGVGLFEAANTMRVRYLLSSKWTLEATTGVASGADLLYTIERGRGARRRLPPVKEVEVPPGADGKPPAQ